MLSRRRALALAGLAAAHWALPDAARAQPLDDAGLPLPRFIPEPEPVPQPEPEPPPEPEPAPPAPVPSLLDGVLLSPDDAWRNDLLPIAVSLDNFAGGARPQFGMDKADLVYELLVEGGISRFMAVYLRRDCEYIEPVRSARTPMLEVCKELGAVLGHVGAASVAGPADADSQFSWWGVPHFDGDISRAPFWRDRRRYAPHNAVTSTLELRGHALGLGWGGPSGLSPWRFKDDGEEDGVPLRAARHLGYGFALIFGAFAAFNASFNYYRDENLYYRSMGGTYHFDGMTGEQLTASNVIIHLAAGWQGSRQGHILYDLIGQGTAFIFRDGLLYQAVWTKRSREDRTRYWHPTGDEFRFNRGRTWVALVPLGSPYWWS